MLKGGFVHAEYVAQKGKLKAVIIFFVFLNGTDFSNDSIIVVECFILYFHPQGFLLLENSILLILYLCEF